MDGRNRVEIDKWDAWLQAQRDALLLLLLLLRGVGALAAASGTHKHEHALPFIMARPPALVQY